MKTKFLLTVALFITSLLNAQEYEWEVENVGSNPGTRIVATFTVPTVDNYKGLQIVGQVIDCNTNWGSALPTVANFSAYINFTGGHEVDIVQSIKTNNIIGFSKGFRY